MANISSTSPLKKQKLNDIGSNATRPNSDKTTSTTSTTRQRASAPTSSSSSPISLSHPACFSNWKASDDEKQSISQSFRSFGTLIKLLDAKYKTIDKLQATIDELQATNKKLEATIESQEKELQKFRSCSQTEGIVKKAVIKKAVEKVTADLKTIGKMTAETQTVLGYLLS
ncbi:hypothetical protein FNV43_RR03763 [Rhamnella rubrinervis]|uniref:Uncharacterized protein n=1 Tax=Rhamnella rubrinervis TaxID=2594499 RepID=A0A8K0MPL3_9ROSA|nr:hypothetical protein FNV43_RR03763 [Rhamnella rubrinervis]